MHYDILDRSEGILSHIKAICYLKDIIYQALTSDILNFCGRLFFLPFCGLCREKSIVVEETRVLGENHHVTRSLVTFSHALVGVKSGKVMILKHFCIKRIMFL